MRVEVHLVGQTPLMVHNVRLANPDEDVVKAIAAINAKARQTEEDRARKRELQWHGALYLGRDPKVGPVMPTANLRRCFRNAGAAIRQWKKIVQALLPTELEVPLLYDGPRNPVELYKLPQHVDTRMAKIPRGGTIPVTRPIWPYWEVRAMFELVTSLMDFDQFVDIVTQAGVIEGLGDGNRIGFGRFTAKIARA